MMAPLPAAAGRSASLPSLLAPALVGAVRRASRRPMRSQGHHMLARSPLGPLPPAHCPPCFYWQAPDHFAGCVERWRPLLGRPPSGLLGGSHLTGRAHPEGALHPAHVGDPTLFQASKQARALTIA